MRQACRHAGRNTQLIFFVLTCIPEDEANCTDSSLVETQRPFDSWTDRPATSWFIPQPFHRLGFKSH